MQSGLTSLSQRLGLYSKISRGIAMDFVVKAVEVISAAIIVALQFVKNPSEYRPYVLGLLAVVIVCSLASTFLENKRRREWEADQKERDRQLPGLIANAIEKRSFLDKPIDRVPEEKTISTDSLSPDEQLRVAQEAVFIKDVVAMPLLDLKSEFANVVDFRDRFNAVPKGASGPFDNLRSKLSGDPIIAARFLRAHLMPRSPYINIVRDVFKAAGRDSYETESDFMFEIHIVNVTSHTTTIQDVIAEAEIGGKWITLPRIDDLSDYECVIEDREDIGSIYQPKPITQTLTNLWQELQGMRLERGIGHQGWLRFGLVTNNSNLEKPINHRVRFVDSLGEIHSVVKVGEFQPPKCDLRHNMAKASRA
jgi:hypothetical protein